MISAEHISTFEPRTRAVAYDSSEYDSLLECFWSFQCRQCSHRCWFLHWREKKIWRRSPFRGGCRYHCACYDHLRGELCNTLCSMEGEGLKVLGFHRKVWTRTKSFSPNIRYFVAILRFVAIYALFGNLWAKKVLFGSKILFNGQEMHYYMIYVAYYTELNL